ncbi:MAG: TetM/TetW/TetO/TetS family tetracycline resistance ribosomal protection protein [Eubacterium sp.]|nr:TetM/TetW/TetO/TetS family tetracycline resistance ribosomal protection protein [Eubacterium sp.]
MKKISIGILAHVDAGKTTLSESLLFNAGTIRKMGRVDNRDAFLDTDEMEKDRGITIFSKQAMFNWEDTEFTLLDTPGHEDFVAETERVLGVIDYAILLVNAADGVTSHTETLFRLLRDYDVPAFIFINKMDYANTDKESIITELNRRLGSGFVDFSEFINTMVYEEIASLDEEAMEEFFDNNTLSEETIRRLIFERKLFPCIAGSALKNTGVKELMDMLSQYTSEQQYGNEFGARVFKISRDEKKNRLSFMKITGGRLYVREELLMDEKVSQIRVYNGQKYTTSDYVEAGDIIAVTGLAGTYPGQALGFEKEDYLPVLTPLLVYRIVLPADLSVEKFLPMIREIEDEEPLLQVFQEEDSSDVMVSIMGDIQLEILEKQLIERYNVRVSFDSGRVLLKETIKNAVYGVGHFEPLRHYAEVHLVLRPLPEGSGIIIDSELSVNELSMNYQNEIISSIRGAFHRGRLRGVIAGLPVTDVKVTLVAGRISLKHTEGGDLREAAIRAFRSALISGEEAGNNVLLEPYERFSITISDSFIGRVLNDISEMGGKASIQDSRDGLAKIEGVAPLRFIRNYQGNLNAFSHGNGMISIIEEMYLPSADQESVRTDAELVNINYDPGRDRRAPVGSVFCANGAGYYVDWQDAFDKSHVEKKIKDYTELEWLYGASFTHDKNETDLKDYSIKTPYYDRAIGVDEIDSILDRALSANKRKDPLYKRKYHYTKNADKVTGSTNLSGGKDSGRTNTAGSGSSSKVKIKKDYLLVDGYNIIHKWKNLKILVEDNIMGARGRLLDMMTNYQAIRGMEVIVVFDAYNVPGNTARIDKYQNINVVYTKQAETADQYIARFTNENTANMNITVATSDGLIQLIIRGAGARLMSATELEEEVEKASEALREKYKIK